jgi:putative ABC transport system permease protein
MALVHVINLRSFGWTMDLSVSLPPLLAAVVVSILAAMLAGAYPARQAMRTPPATGLREE